MKVAVSNIVWDSTNLGPFLELCAKLNCQGIELAPNKIWPEPLDAPKTELNQLRNNIHANGLSLTGFHALLYTRPDLKLFGSVHSRISTLQYLCELAGICSDMGGKNMILGSPLNRSLMDRPYSECFQMAAEGFSCVAEACATHEVVLCIEPLSPSQTDFISSASEGDRLVQAVNHPNFGLHLDASALREETDSPSSTIAHTSMPHHFHANDPGLTPPGTSTDDLPAMLATLRAKNYTGYISIETLAHDSPAIEVVTNAVAYVRQAIET